MRVFLRSYVFWGGVFVVLLAAYLASPLVAAANLASGVKARDVPAVMSRVEPGPLRRSLTRQIVRAYLMVHDRNNTADGLSRQIAVGLASSALDPVLRQLTTPEMIAEFLDSGWPGVAPPGKTPKLSIGDIKDAFSHFDRASFTGLTHFRIMVDLDGDPKRRLGWRFRINGFRWKLYAIDLPPAVLSDIVARMPTADRMKIEGPEGERKIF